MFRCGSLAIMRPSSRKRRSACTVSADASSPLRRMILIATLRSSDRCSARYTVDMPPEPSGRSNSYPGIWMEPFAIHATPWAIIDRRARAWLGTGSALRQRERHFESALRSVGERDAPAVGLGDLARERQSESGAAALRRIERQQRARQHRFAHAVAAIANFDAQFGAAADHCELHRVGRAARFVRVLEQVDEHLLELCAVE